MFDTIFGLPMHPLIVHATVVIVPAAAAAVALAALWPWFRRWAGVLPLLLSAVAVVLVPVTTSSGEALERRLPHNALIERHTQLADGLLLPVLVLGIAAIAVTWVYAREETAASPDGRIAALTGRITGTGGRPAPAILAVVMLIAVVASVATLVQVARIGHSGARAAWSGVAQSSVPAGK